MDNKDDSRTAGPHLFSIVDFAATHAISRTQAYREIGAGRLIASKVGKRTVITAENAAAWRAALPAFDRKAA
jgi:hypothetical protein